MNAAPNITVRTCARMLMASTSASAVMVINWTMTATHAEKVGFCFFKYLICTCKSDLHARVRTLYPASYV